MSASAGCGFFRSRAAGGHNLPRHTVAALGHVGGDPGLLDRMAGVGGEAFNGGDLFAGGSGHRGDAGADGVAIEPDGAGATLA